MDSRALILVIEIGVSRNKEYLFGVHRNKDYHILESILVSPYSGKQPNQSRLPQGFWGDLPLAGSPAIKH